MKDTEGPLGRAMEHPSRLASTCKTNITLKIDWTLESLRVKEKRFTQSGKLKTTVSQSVGSKSSFQLVFLPLASVYLTTVRA